jgi:endonuclease/exonuclease/phosphatase family metal-dependent hydrolase
VSIIEPRSDELNEAFSSEMDVRLANGKRAKRRIFHRRPLFLDVRITQGSAQVFDFRCAVVHLKSTDAKLADTGSSLRAAAARLLARWIADDRGQGIETDYLILGDMNAETAEQGLRDFSEQNGLDLLSVGMRETYGQDDALTRVASKRLLDHIVVTSDSVALMPEKDLGEQIIIRSDAVLSDWTREFSDHVPVAVRFVLRSDVD